MNIAKKKLDFMDRLNEYINTLDLYARSRIGLLSTDDSISVMAMPGGEETVFFDGIRDKDYQIQVSAKSKDQNNCYTALTDIYQDLERLDELESKNGSFDFQNIKTASLPNLIGQDDDGFFIWGVNLSCKITIYEE